MDKLKKSDINPKNKIKTIGRNHKKEFFSIPTNSTISFVETSDDNKLKIKKGMMIKVKIITDIFLKTPKIEINIFLYLFIIILF